MTPERWQQVQSLLHAALAVPAADRAGVVAAVCAGDEELQRELASLLVYASEATGFLSTPALALSRNVGQPAATLVGRTIGLFTITAKLGSGGMGDVYLADDAELRRPVALKALREDGAPTPEGRERLLREARAAAALNHPHIATIFHVRDSVEADTPPLIVMEYVEGETLSERLKEGRLPPGDALRFGSEIADALASAHRHGIIHRDLKPANLRVSEERRIKVLDFGLAHQMRMPTAATSTTESALKTVVAHGLAGTPGYMSPEQVLGRAVEPSTDVFSLGIVLFEMLTGQRLFPAEDFLSAAIATITMPAPRVAEVVPDIPAGVDALVARMLERDAAMRPSAADVAEELRRLLQPVAPPWRRLAIPAGIFAVLAVSAIVAREPLMRRLGYRAAGPPPRISLATLPLDEPGPDSAASHVGASIMAVIAGNFGSIPSVTVLPRAAAVPYLKEADNFASLQRALGATHVLKLSWRSVEPSLRLEARLYRPGLAAPQWQATFEGDAAAIERDALSGLGRAFERGEPFRQFTTDQWDRARRLPTASSAALMAHAEARAVLDRPAPDLDRVIGLLQQATTLDQRFVFAWSLLGDVWWLKYQRDKDPALVAKATDALRRAVALDPDSPLVHYAIGGMQYRTGELSQAEASFRRALQLQPDFDPAQRDLAQVLAGSGRLGEAETLLRDAIRVSGNWNNHYMLGTIEYRAGQYAAAADAFRRAAEATPNNAAAFTMLGNSQYVLGDFPQAVGNFEHAARLGPTPAAYANLALAYYDAGRLEDALRSYEQALQRDPKSAVNHRNIGDVKARLGRAADARAEYERAIALGNELLRVNPRDIRTIALIALCEAKLGRRAVAERHAAEAVALDSSSREAWQRSAEVHALLHQDDEALRDLAVAVARGFEPRMARRDDELASLRSLPRFGVILTNSPGNSAQTRGSRP